MKDLITSAQLFKWMPSIKAAKRIVVCGHKNPDGDALGSSLGWADYLRGLGKSVTVIAPTPFADVFKSLKGAEEVLFYSIHQKIVLNRVEKADTIFCLDFSGWDRLGDLASVIKNSKAEKHVLDHHLEPDASMGKWLFSFPHLSSTCELVFRLICQLGGYEALTKAGAEAIYTGMMTDTGAFTYNSSSPEIYEIISLLLSKGIDKDQLYRNVFHNYSVSRLRLQGYILYEKLHFLANDKVAFFTMTREEMKRFNYLRGDSEGFVNLPLQVKGVRLSISLREDTETDVIRVSLRSVGDFPCNEMAKEYFNGGGHLNASGGSLPFPMEEGIKVIEQAIKAYQNYLV